MSELQVRTKEQLLQDFAGEVEPALKMQNLIESFFAAMATELEANQVLLTHGDPVTVRDASGSPSPPAVAANIVGGVLQNVVIAGTYAIISGGFATLTAWNGTQISMAVAINNGNPSYNTGTTIVLMSNGVAINNVIIDGTPRTITPIISNGTLTELTVT